MLHILIFLEAVIFTVIKPLKMKELLKSKLNSCDPESKPYDEENVPLLDIIPTTTLWSHKTLKLAAYTVILLLSSLSLFVSGYIFCYSTNFQENHDQLGTFRNGFRTEFCNVSSKNNDPV